VPWRFLDAGQLSVRRVSSLPASKNLHKSRHEFIVTANLAVLLVVGTFGN
jgi:hypothetical protein